MKKNNNRKGFTIVELVIVIAVIAILAAVMIPTFSGIITDANESAALQEARNIYTQYVAEKADEAGFTDDVWVQVDSSYYQVTDGSLSTTAGTPAAGATLVSISNGTITVTTKS